MRRGALVAVLAGIPVVLSVGCARRSAPEAPPPSQAEECSAVAAASFCSPVSEEAPVALGDSETCPVMGDRFKVSAASPRSEYQGKRFAFCCGDCKARFDAEPNRFASR